MNLMKIKISPQQSMLPAKVAVFSIETAPTAMHILKFIGCRQSFGGQCKVLVMQQEERRLELAKMPPHVPVANP